MERSHLRRQSLNGEPEAAERVNKSGRIRIFYVQDERIVGDSHLAISLPQDARPSPNAEISVTVAIGVNRPDGSTDDVEMIMLPNDEGRLSEVSIKLNAENFDDAEDREAMDRR